MKIKNNGEAFIVRYNNDDLKIKNGTMIIADEALGKFIMSKARSWGFDKNIEVLQDTVKGAIEDVEDEKKVEKNEVKAEIKKSDKKVKK